MRAGISAMLPIIIIAVIATIVALGLYLLLLKKYYWGPQGAPKKEGQNKKDGKL